MSDKIELTVYIYFVDESYEHGTAVTVIAASREEADTIAVEHLTGFDGVEKIPVSKCRVEEAPLERGLAIIADSYYNPMLAFKGP